MSDKRFPSEREIEAWLKEMNATVDAKVDMPDGRTITFYRIDSFVPVIVINHPGIASVWLCHQFRGDDVDLTARHPKFASIPSQEPS